MSPILLLIKNSSSSIIILSAMCGKVVKTIFGLIAHPLLCLVCILININDSLLFVDCMSCHRQSFVIRATCMGVRGVDLTS